MNANSASILVNPHPCGHVVYPYTDETRVAHAVALFANAGIRAGEGVILIMSDDHNEAIKLRLQLDGISAEAYERSGQLICAKAEDLLAKFTPGGVLNENIFKSTVGSMIQRARGSVTTGQHGRVRLFGEMVSQLRSKDLSATARLEELWNDVIVEHSVSLLCTYALNGVEDHIPEALLDLHSHSLQQESTR